MYIYIHIFIFIYIYIHPYIYVHTYMSLHVDQFYALLVSVFQGMANFCFDDLVWMCEAGVWERQAAILKLRGAALVRISNDVYYITYIYIYCI